MAARAPAARPKRPTPRRGTWYVYLTAVMDWYSRYVLSWRLSNSLDGAFCIAALEEALMQREPEIFNTDQGVQFTSLAFTSCLESRGVAISMDGRGRALDNVFVERLWRTVKYEEVYLKDYENPRRLKHPMPGYFSRRRYRCGSVPSNCRKAYPGR
jgi:putative transposase